jgi:lipopolysaccharide/colanic/teichoic acid biosynthesis glycosyltransferase
MDDDPSGETMRDARFDLTSGSEATDASADRQGLSRSARAYMPVKCTLEWCAALLLLIVAVPVIAVLGILLKLTSPGPIFYSQMRLGLNGRAFRIYKLRTMTHLCEATTGPVWSVYPDPRITPIGKWLRDTHLDELPQLWNVLRGDMCLVGPRPERPEIAAAIERRMPTFRDRLAVRPGITGLAQVRLPPDSNLDTVRQKLAHDLCYIRRFSPAMDVRIVLATGLQVLGAAASELAERCVRGVSPPIVDLPPVTAGFRMPPEIEIDSEGTRAAVEQPVRSRAA